MYQEALEVHCGSREDNTVPLFHQGTRSQLGTEEGVQKKINVYLLLGEHQGERLTLPRGIREDFREEAIMVMSPEG